VVRGFWRVIHGSCMDDSRALELGVFTLILIVYLASRCLFLLWFLFGCGIDYGPSAFCDRSHFFLLEVLQVLISLSVTFCSSRLVVFVSFLVTNHEWNQWP
jgi:hypothetical protein